MRDIISRFNKSTRVWAAAGVLALFVAPLVSGYMLGLIRPYELAVAWFGPPRATMTQAYAVRPDAPEIDHADWDAVVKEHVTDDGFVDYTGLARDPARLDTYLRVLAEAPFDQMDRRGKLALLLNAYNAFTLRLIVDHWPEIDSIRDIPAADRWRDARWRVGRHTWSLHEIEHDQIRNHFREPDIHFALVCAARSCPPLRAEAYVAERVDAQLEDQAERVHRGERWCAFNRESNRIRLTPLYLWYRGDFRQVSGGVLDHAAGYVPELKAAIEAGSPPTIEWMGYDWSLNDAEGSESSGRPDGSATER